MSDHDLTDTRADLDGPARIARPAEAMQEPQECPTASDTTIDPADGPCGFPGPPTRDGAPAIACPCGSDAPVFRRGRCRSCYRKLGEAGVPIGSDGRVVANVVRGLRQVSARLSGAPQERLDALVERMPVGARDRLERALARARGMV